MSKLTDVIALLYRYTESDTDKLAKQLNERMRAAWVNALSELAKKHGCDRLAGVPKGADARKLREDARRDAESVARTYNRELTEEINRLAAANPKGNRQYYISNLNKWQKKRDSHKLYAIGLNTDTNAREYAFQRFYMENAALARRFVAAGPPAVCEKCITIFAAGVVDFAYTQSHPFPQHYLCPHWYQAVAPAKAECATLWLG